MAFNVTNFDTSKFELKLIRFLPVAALKVAYQQDSSLIKLELTEIFGGPCWA